MALDVLDGRNMELDLMFRCWCKDQGTYLEVVAKSTYETRRFVVAA